MRIALDIDDTITAMPKLFAALTTSRAVEKCIIVSSRTAMPEAYAYTKKELSGYGIRYDHLFLIADYKEAEALCPHKQLNWHQKYLWQKVKICLDHGIDVIFEDDEKVIALFKTYAPQIVAIQVHRKNDMAMRQGRS